jgi:transcriptional regulator with XRE-family HTH domain
MKNGIPPAQRGRMDESEQAFAEILDRVGRQIAARRKYLRLTLREIEARTGIDIGTLSRYERGKVGSTYRLDVLIHVALALDIPLMQLLEPFIDYVSQRQAKP